MGVGGAVCVVTTMVTINLTFTGKGSFEAQSSSIAAGRDNIIAEFFVRGAISAGNALMAAREHRAHARASRGNGLLDAGADRCIRSISVNSTRRSKHKCGHNRHKCPPHHKPIRLSEVGLSLDFVKLGPKSMFSLGNTTMPGGTRVLVYIHFAPGGLLTNFSSCFICLAPASGQVMGVVTYTGTRVPFSPSNSRCLLRTLRSGCKTGPVHCDSDGTRCTVGFGRGRDVSVGLCGTSTGCRAVVRVHSGSVCEVTRERCRRVLGSGHVRR